MATNSTENPTKRGLGSSDTASLSEQFPSMPTDFDPKAFWLAAMNGDVVGNPLVGGTFNLDYEDAPNLLDSAIQDDPTVAGLVPNPTPPPVGDANPVNKGPAPSDYPPPPSGWGSSTSPSETASKIAEQKFDQLVPGKSY